jgi:tripartite-type tricarboxylate transporter receptor subunit TctC
MIEGQGVDLVASSPGEFGAFLDQQMAQWAAVIREKGIRAE